MSAKDIGPTQRPPYSSELYAASRVIGFKCFDENVEFMKCRPTLHELNCLPRPEHTRPAAAAASRCCHATAGRRALPLSHAYPPCTHGWRRKTPPCACRAGSDDNPNACTAEGTKVHGCVYSLYKEISAKAPKQFADFAKCIDGEDLRVHRCKETQDAFETAFYNAQ